MNDRNRSKLSVSRSSPALEKITGLLPSDIDGKRLYREHLLRKYRS